eukprot:3268671-Pleurochrysis_carterae.AAC.1
MFQATYYHRIYKAAQRARRRRPSKTSRRSACCPTGLPTGTDGRCTDLKAKFQEQGIEWTPFHPPRPQ